MEEVAMMTGSTTGGVVTGTEGAGHRRGAYDAGDDSLAGGLLRRAAAALHLLREEAQYSVLVAVEQRLSPA